MIEGKRKNFVDLTGKKFGMLKVVHYIGRRETPSGSFKSDWLCKCDCGNFSNVTSPRLNGGQKSCGCLVVSKLKEVSTKHGLSNSPEYNSYHGMKDRCNNSKNKDWKNYGGRGIKVCQRWEESFENFINDMGFKDMPNLSIDRIDVDGDYSLENCRWATIEQQNNNRTNTTFINAFGINKPITYWAKAYGIRIETLRRRIGKLKWSIEKAFLTPTRRWESK